MHLIRVNGRRGQIRCPNNYGRNLRNSFDHVYGVKSLTYDLLRNSGSLQTGSEDTGRRSSSDNVNRFETLFAQCPYQILYRNPFDMSDDPRPYIIL